ncbi:hypothetical protein [Pseudomonas mosselii]|uniref:hypothetical protein n=1 Tax=Pseudomonas mosselii TaxID=78327 RepID=UPI000C12ACA2|nr:hypothetical protein [Pseudomonas mosselii]
MANYQIEAAQSWQGFSYQNKRYCLDHLASHEIKVKANVKEYRFVITYGLHCFTKCESEFAINYRYYDSRESRLVCDERYEASKALKGIMEGVSEYSYYQTQGIKYFTMQRLNSLSGAEEPYKICLAFFKENRLMRIHVTSAFFVRSGEGADGKISRKAVSFYKVAMDTDLNGKGKIPKEATKYKK